jgi:hypothetical protein
MEHMIITNIIIASGYVSAAQYTMAQVQLRYSIDIYNFRPQ